MPRDANLRRSAPPLPQPEPIRHRSIGACVRAQLARARALDGSTPERFGFREDSAARLFRVTAAFYRRYFRVETHGLETLPTGRVLLVAHHGSHALAWDGAMILTSCLLDADPPRLVHAMADHRLMKLPVLGRAAQRIGAVDGLRSVCEELLRAGAAVLTFPEGAPGSKGLRNRYELAPLRQGFMHVAIATRTPIVPVAVIGAEEDAPLLANPRWLARFLGTPTAPVTPTLLVPLPVKYRIHFGGPLRFAGPITTANVAHGVTVVRAALENLIQRGLTARKHVFF